MPPYVKTSTPPPPQITLPAKGALLFDIVAFTSPSPIFLLYFFFPPQFHGVGKRAVPSSVSSFQDQASLWPRWPMNFFTPVFPLRFPLFLLRASDSGNELFPLRNSFLPLRKRAGVLYPASHPSHPLVFSGRFLLRPEIFASRRTFRNRWRTPFRWSPEDYDHPLFSCGFRGSPPLPPEAKPLSSPTTRKHRTFTLDNIIPPLTSQDHPSTPPKVTFKGSRLADIQQGASFFLPVRVGLPSAMKVDLPLVLHCLFKKQFPFLPCFFSEG